jgi:hypothetical protein
MKAKYSLRALSLLIAAAVLGIAWRAGIAQVTPNPIQAENARAGTTAWMIRNAAVTNTNAQTTPSAIEGYASAASVNRGGQITFYVNTSDPSYTLRVFRLGYYGGLGGRAETDPITLPGAVQTIPQPDAATGMVDCNWSPAYTLTTGNPSDPSDWVSGVYVALLTGSQSGLQSYITFIVRDDSRASNILFQSAVATSQAYNNYGGKSLYTYNSSQGVAAIKVSFNRPYFDGQGTGNFMSFEWDLMAYLEQQGYDVTYATDVDTHTSPAQVLQHKVFLAVGHNEYWSWEMRQNVTAALNAGVDLGFFGANDVYWQIRYETSPATGQANRVIVCYKTLADAEDPMAANPSTYYLITDLWRAFKISYPGLPEAQLIGEMYNGQEPMNAPVVVSNASSWVFNGTGLANGSQLRGLQGFEADQIYPSGISPTNVIQLAHSPYTINSNTYYGDMSLYQASSGAWVFATGSMYFQYGLSALSPWSPSPSVVSPAAQQITQNVLNAFIAGTVPGGQPTPTSSPTPTPTGPISLRGVAVGGAPASGGSSVTVNVPTGVQVGDVLVAHIGVRGTGQIGAPSGWSLVRRDTASTTAEQAIYTRVVPYWPAEPAKYTWTFSAGNNAAGGIADYIGVSNSTPVDVSGGQSNANSANIVAPPVSIPPADNSDQLLNLYTIANVSGFVLPYGTTPEYGYIPGGISIGMSDLALSSGGPTVAESATAYAAAANLGAQLALLPGPPASQPAIFLRSIGTGSNSTPSPSVTVNVPAGAQPGDLMIAQIGVRGGSGQSITAPGGWSLVRSDFSGTAIIQSIYSHAVSSSEPSTYTWNFRGNNNAAGGIADFFGASAASPVDVSNGLGNTSSTSITAPGVVIPSTSSNDHLLCLFSTAGGVAPVTPVGTTSEWSFPAASFGIGVAMSDVASVPAGATNTQLATTSTAYANVGVQLALH